MSLTKQIAFALSPLLWFPLAGHAAGPYAVYETDTAFEDVIEGVKMGIQERGMYINNVMHMAEMLERTGKDLGMDEKIYEKAESVEFCSAVLSRKMTSEDPSRIVNCPFIMSIYVLPGEPDKTYVAHRTVSDKEIQSSAVMAEISEMLKGVAETAIAW
ncbi:MAG: DUF302 domain-containing protein [Pseudomonadota bacterium]|nr:DUF302 domain-containing protein [Pseudomonadota bacterium]